MTYPSFSVGETLTSSAMNAVGLWRVTTCTVSSVGGTAATASNGVITIGTNNTSITVNNAFSSDYQSYRIFIFNNDTNGSASHLLQFSGITGSVYYSGGSYGAWGAAAQTGFGNAATTFLTLSANCVAGTPTQIMIDISNPNLALRKLGFNTSQAGNGHLTFNHLCNSTSTATGFVISKSGETMTGGTIRVYGYRN
jgi:hypothetical protein